MNYVIIKANLISILLLFVLALYLDSRAFSIGYFIALLLIVCVHTKRHRRLAVIISVSVAVVAVYSLSIFYKNDSTNGRLLIYKISGKILTDALPSGIGLGKFPNTFPTYQACYFQTADFSKQELLLADNTFYAFNDYLQLTIETGVVGIAIIALMALFLRHLVIHLFQYEGTKRSSLLFPFSHLLAILIAACFTHVFEKLFFQVASVWLIAICAVQVHRPKSDWKCILLAVFLLLASFVYITANLSRSRENPAWTNARNLWKAGFTTEAEIQYNKLVNELKDSPLYLTEYGDVLMQQDKCASAIVLFQRALEKTKDNRLYNRLGDCYSKLKDLKSAETAYMESIFIVPNRFVSRYKLFKLYMSTRQYHKASECGEKIMRLPIKIQSNTVTAIRKEVSKELSMLNQTRPV